MVALGVSCAPRERPLGNVDPANAGGDTSGDVGTDGTHDGDGLGGRDLGSVSHGGSNGGQPETAEPDAGAGGEAEASLRIVMTSPADGDVDVERDEPIEVRFSEPIDPDSVTAESVVVSGPDGVIDGQLSTQGEKIVFTAAAPYNLLAAISVDLSTAIGNLKGVSLAGRGHIGFRVRDGELGTPERISTDDTTDLRIVGTLSGHVGLSWSAHTTAAASTKSRPVVALFEPKAASWGMPAPLFSEPTATSYVSLSLDEQGEAFAAVATSDGSGSVNGGWLRRTGPSWGVPHFDEFADMPHAQLANDGSALVTLLGPDAALTARILAPDDTWSSPHVFGDKPLTWSSARFDSGFLVTYSRASDSALFASRFSTADGWQAPRRITGAGGKTTAALLATRGDSALVVYRDETDGWVKACRLEDEGWSSPSRIQTVATDGFAGPSASAGGAGFIVAWSDFTEMWARIGGLDGTWKKPIQLGNGVWGGPPTPVIDDEGNAVVAWQNGNSIFWRRWVASTATWSEVNELKDIAPRGYLTQTAIDGSGNVTLAWSNALGIWAARFE
jgi:hypothetical protein